MPGIHWYARDIQLLRQHYPTHGPDGTAKLMRAAGRPRTPKAITSAAKRIGLKVTPEPRWHPRPCAQCGKPFHKRDSERINDYNRRHHCSQACANIRTRARQAATNRQNAPTKTCRVCNTTFSRAKPNGNLQKSDEWKARQTCSRACGYELRRRTITEKYARATANVEHPPCTQCGNAVARRNKEPVSRWLARVTCTNECQRAARSTALERATTARVAAPRVKRERKRRAPKERKQRGKLAPEGYVFDGRFPTPASVTTWQSVAGPDTGVVITTFMPSRAARCPTTLAALASAISAHPDFGMALAGILGDSWVQQDAAA